MVQKLTIALLAAGQSSRLGQNKCLVSCNGEPWILHKAKQLLALPALFAPTLDIKLVLVSGFQADLLRKAIRPVAQELNFVENKAWQQGLGNSVSLAASYAEQRGSALMLCLVDQWQLDTRHYQHCIAHWLASKKPISHAQCGAVALPPVLTERRCLALFTKLNGPKGAAALLQQHANLCSAFVMEQAIEDLDTPAQLAQFRQRFVE